METKRRHTFNGKFEQAERDGRLCVAVGARGKYTDVIFPITLAEIQRRWPIGTAGVDAVIWPTQCENTGKAGILCLLND